MVNYPIFEEVKNFIYTNLESIFLVIVPLATLIGWLTERHNKRLNNIEEAGLTAIKELKEEIDKKDKELQEHKKEFNDFKVEATKSIGILKALVMRDYDFDEDADNELNYTNIRKIRKRKNNSKRDINPS